MECKLLKRGSDSKFKALARGKQQCFSSERDLLPGMGEQMVKFRRIFLAVSTVFQEAYSSALPQKTPQRNSLGLPGLEAAMSRGLYFEGVFLFCGQQKKPKIFM